MKVFFSVNSPKVQKRESGRGEDAPVVNQDGLMIICDGTGATGQSEHIIRSQTYTSAYLGSRETSKAAQRFLSEHFDQLMGAFGAVEDLQKTVAQLGEAIQKHLMEYAEQNKLSLTVCGKSFKLLPTTFTAVLYQAHQDAVEAIVLCAGDSRALWWDEEGLHQLTIEDSAEGCVSFGDCHMSNCVAADADFSISFCCHTLKPKGVLLATSDGFTDPLRPFEQERYLIEWIGNFDHVCEERSEALAGQVARKMDEIGFTKRDDCSMAGVILGYSTDAELKDHFRKRYSRRLIEAYLKPYQQLHSRSRQTAAELDEAKIVLAQNEQKLIGWIKKGITDYLQHCGDLAGLHRDSRFQTLMTADAVGVEIRDRCLRIQQNRQEKAALRDRKERELLDGYLEFLMQLCRDYGAVRFPEQLIRSVQAYDETRALLSDRSESIRRELSVLKSLPEPTTLQASFLDRVETAAKKLMTDVTCVKENQEAYQKNKRTVEQYFSFQNEAVCAFFREDMENRFEILKKTSRLPLFKSKKQIGLQTLAEALLQLHGTVEKLKLQLTDDSVRQEENAACRSAVLEASGAVARELWEKEKYRAFLTEEQAARSGEWQRCEQLRQQLEQELAQKEELLQSYHSTYHKYLDTAVAGRILIRKKGVRSYESN